MKPEHIYKAVRQYSNHQFLCFKPGLFLMYCTSGSTAFEAQRLYLTVKNVHQIEILPLRNRNFRACRWSKSFLYWKRGPIQTEKRVFERSNFKKRNKSRCAAEYRMSTVTSYKTGCWTGKKSCPSTNSVPLTHYFVQITSSINKKLRQNKQWKRAGKENSWYVRKEAWKSEYVQMRDRLSVSKLLV